MVLQLTIDYGTYGTYEIHLVRAGDRNVRVATLVPNTRRGSGAVHIQYHLPGLHDRSVDEPPDNKYARHGRSLRAAKKVAVDTVEAWFGAALEVAVTDLTDRKGAGQ